MLYLYYSNTGSGSGGGSIVVVVVGLVEDHLTTSKSRPVDQKENAVLLCRHVSWWRRHTSR